MINKIFIFSLSLAAMSINVAMSADKLPSEVLISAGIEKPSRELLLQQAKNDAKLHPENFTCTTVNAENISVWKGSSGSTGGYTITLDEVCSYPVKKPVAYLPQKSYRNKEVTELKTVSLGGRITVAQAKELILKQIQSPDFKQLAYFAEHTLKQINNDLSNLEKISLIPSLNALQKTYQLLQQKMYMPSFKKITYNEAFQIIKNHLAQPDVVELDMFVEYTLDRINQDLTFEEKRKLNPLMEKLVSSYHALCQVRNMENSIRK
jgi:hypothetical protein